MTGFVPSQHGFPFTNWFPPGTPIVVVPTPFGTVKAGDANGGVCGGMVFAALDLFAAERPVPPEPTEPVVRYLCRRLLNSFDLPFGVMRYYDLQRRPGASRFAGGVRIRPRRDSVDGRTRVACHSRGTGRRPASVARAGEGEFVPVQLARAKPSGAGDRLHAG